MAKWRWCRAVAGDGVGVGGAGGGTGGTHESVGPGTGGGPGGWGAPGTSQLQCGGHITSQNYSRLGQWKCSSVA